MNKVKSTKIITIFTVISALAAFISAFFSSLLPLYLSYKLNIDTRNASSIGIIGGADGPTAIFVSARSSSHLFTIIFVSLTILGVIYLVIAKNHN
ncbi:MAG: sodium ion-translocating decarboxylase subunit beta [Tepidanaerobacteraceae bacterium]|nr:sodium ion-translocating decarboxylase subunit beta [Thermoanaerobacterales bacterium]